MKNKIDELIGLLEKAHEMSLSSIGGYSDHFLTATEFRKALKDAIERLTNEQNTQEEIIKLRSWFKPSCDWDDFVGDVELGNEIYSQLSAMVNS